MTTKFQNPPIFDLFTIDELSRRLGVTKRYLCDLEDGTKPIGQRFRWNFGVVLPRLSEAPVKHKDRIIMFVQLSGVEYSRDSRKQGRERHTHFPKRGVSAPACFHEIWWWIEASGVYS